MVLAGIFFAAACSNEHAPEEKPDAAYTPVAGPSAPRTPRPAVAENPEHEYLVVRARVDSVDRRLRRVPGLSLAERARLRRDVNAVQIERAKQLGVSGISDVDRLVRAGGLVRLPDVAEYWVVRELRYSVPYVTPGAEAMLVEIGQRFHARLDSLGLPAFSPRHYFRAAHAGKTIGPAPRQLECVEHRECPRVRHHR